MSEYKLYLGDCLEVMRGLPSDSVNCCVTSPPYYAQRNYNVDGQIGLERTPEEYVAKLVDVFREVQRLLRDDGTLWLNLGDSYGGSGGGSKKSGNHGPHSIDSRTTDMYPKKQLLVNLGKKQLLGIPWRVALALQSDGWILRSDIIWHKPSCMPESAKDRPTRNHEYIFLLSKSPKYYYDYEAIMEPVSKSTVERYMRRPTNKDNPDLKTNKEVFSMSAEAQANAFAKGRKIIENGETLMRNKRTVWTVSQKYYNGAHFATYPPDLIKPCILAGCPIGGTVLDPFNGSGTTGVVCMEYGRNYIGIDLNPEYIEMSDKRIKDIQQQMRLSL